LEETVRVMSLTDERVAGWGAERWAESKGMRREDEQVQRFEQALFEFQRYQGSIWHEIRCWGGRRGWARTFAFTLAQQLYRSFGDIMLNSPPSRPGGGRKQTLASAGYEARGVRCQARANGE
jgi:hypothetical protein